MPQSPETPPQEEMPDVDALLRANLERVFNDRAPHARRAAVDALYREDAVLYDPAGSVQGRVAIADLAGRLLEQFGPGFRFTPVGTATGHHGLAALRWQAGREEGPVALTGTDVAAISDGKIQTLWVLIDPPQTPG